MKEVARLMACRGATTCRRIQQATTIKKSRRLPHHAALTAPSRERWLEEPRGETSGHNESGRYGTEHSKRLVVSAFAFRVVRASAFRARQAHMIAGNREAGASRSYRGRPTDKAIQGPIEGAANNDQPEPDGVTSEEKGCH